MTPSAADDGPGSAIAPAKPDVLREPGDLVLCPHCRADLTSGGAVRQKTYRYVDLKVDARNGDYLEVDYGEYEDSFTKEIECAACYGALAAEGWNW